MSEKISFVDLLPWAATGGAGMLGRIVFHAVQVQKGARKPFSMVLLWDIPVAVFMGWVALGAATWLRVPWEPTVSIALIAAYLGPYGIDTLFAAYANRYANSGKKGE